MQKCLAHRVIQENLSPQVEAEEQIKASSIRHGGSPDNHLTLESIVKQMKEQPALTEEQLQKVCITLKDFEVG